MNNQNRGYCMVSYITWIGWLVAYFAGDRNDPMLKQHLNQAFVLNIASIIIGFLNSQDGIFQTVGSFLSLCVFIFEIMGIYRAYKMVDEPLPLIGDIKVF